MDPLGRAGPDPAGRIDAKTVEQTGRGFREHLAAREAGALDGELPDVFRTVLFVGRAGVGEVEKFLVGREGDPVRTDRIGDDRVDGAGFGVQAIDVAAADFPGRLVALIVGVDAISGVGEPDRIVRLHHEVVRRVEALAVPFVREHGDRTVDLGARDAARQMLAGDQPALVVDAVAVRIVRALAEYGDFAGGLDEPHHAIVRYVGPDEIA